MSSHVSSHAPTHRPVKPLAHSTRSRMWSEAMETPLPVSGGAGPSAPGGTASPPPPPGAVSLKQARMVAAQIMGSKILTALVVFLFTLLLLICINPPMAQQCLTEEERAAGKAAPRSWKKIMVWSLLVFGVALLMPVAASYWPSTTAASAPGIES